MATVNILPAFDYKWAQTGTVEAISDDQWKVGWAYIGATPPSVEQFNKWGQIFDEKANYLFSLQKALTDASGQTLSAADATTLVNSIRSNALLTGPVGGTGNAITLTYAPAVPALVDNMVLWFKAPSANTGPATLNVNGLGVKTLRGPAHLPLQGGEIAVNSRVMAVWSASADAFTIVESTGGAVQVAPGVWGNQAVNLGQIHAPMAAAATQAATNTTIGVTASFTAPGPGLLVGLGSRNVGGTPAPNNTGELLINGVSKAADNTPASMTHFGYATTAGGVVSATYNTASPIAFSANVMLVWIPNL